jgi:hypothetical protein
VHGKTINVSIDLADVSDVKQRVVYESVCEENNSVGTNDVLRQEHSPIASLRAMEVFLLQAYSCRLTDRALTTALSTQATGNQQVS